MKTTLTILAATLMCVAVGCEKKSEKAAEGTVYDPSIDGPPSVLAPAADAGILADQTRATGRPRPAAATPPAPRPATAADVQALKRQLAAALAEAKGGRMDGMANLFPEPLAKGMRAMSALPGKLKAFEQLVKDKLGMDLPDKLKSEALGPVGGAGPGGASFSPAGDLEKASIDELKFAIQGQKIVATDPKGKEVAFVSTPRGWKMEIPAEARDFVTVLVEVSEATLKVIDTLTAGINDGSITKDNFEAKADEVGQQHMKGPMEKFAKIFGEMMTKAFAQVAPGPAPGPPTPTPAPPTPTPGPPTPVPPAPGLVGDVEAVKQLLTKAGEAVKAGNPGPFVNLFTGPAAGTFGKVLALKKKADALKPVLRKNFGVLGVHFLRAQFDQAAKMAKQLPTGPVAKMTFATDGPKVLVTMKDSDQAIVFAKTPQGWKGSLQTGQEKDAAETAALADRMAAMFDELTAGINSGSVTADNLDVKVTQLLIKHKFMDTRREAPRRTTF